MLTADAIQARYRESVRPALVDRAQSISAAAVDRRPASGLDTAAQRDADEDTAAASAAAAEGDEQPAEQRRRRFTAAASLALQKSLDGPQLDAEPSALTAQTLRSLLAKTSAANVSCVVSDTHFTNTHTHSLHLAPDRQPRQHPTTQFLQAGCPSCHPTNSVKALKALHFTNNTPKITMNYTTDYYFFKPYQHFGNFKLYLTVSESCLMKLLPYILFEKYIYILALEMASPWNQHCANCIGALSFPIT